MPDRTIQRDKSNHRASGDSRSGPEFDGARRPSPTPRTLKRRRATAADRVFVGFDMLFVIVLGAAMGYQSAYPQLWPFQLLIVAAFAWRIGRASVGRTAVLSFTFGTAWLAAGTWWLYISMHRYGGLSAPLSAAAVLGLAAFLSLHLTVAMALFARLRRNRAVVDALLFAGCWLLAELGRGVLLTGFPWASSGYMHVDSPLAKLAPLVGVYGIGAVAALLAAGVAFGGRVRDQEVSGAVLGLVLGGLVLIGIDRLPMSQLTIPTGQLSLSLLQPNVPQNEKFKVEVLPETVAWATDKLMNSKGDLVIGPETVIPLLPSQLSKAQWDPLLKHFQRGDRAALFGRPLGELEGEYTNSAVGISRDTVKMADGQYRYDKNHLVPFGEFIPKGFRWFTDMMNIPLGDFTRGARNQPSFAFRTERVAPNICYEDLFGEELAVRFREPARSPTIFANLTNIGWFGDTIAVRQHLHISRMRAMEFQRPMVRATNTGTTAVIDHTGQVTAALPAFTQGVLEAKVEGRRGMTPFASWASTMGLWPLLIAGLLPWVFCLVLRRQED